MAYMTYQRDMSRVGKDFKKWGATLLKVHDPFKLFIPTARYCVIPGFKAIFFTIRRLINR